MAGTESGPMFLRSRAFIHRPQRIITEDNHARCELALNPRGVNDKYSPAYRAFKQHGPLDLVFIGSSHVTHMDYQTKAASFPDRSKFALQQTMFVGVGGLKFSTAESELNGLFDNEDKARKYGNQWLEYKKTCQRPSWAICLLGSNDTDDSHGYFVLRKSKVTDKDYIATVKQEISQWIKDLKPHVVKFFHTVELMCPGAQLGYVPIIPRIWWGDEA